MWPEETATCQVFLWTQELAHSSVNLPYQKKNLTLGLNIALQLLDAIWLEKAIPKTLSTIQVSTSKPKLPKKA